MNLFRSEEHVAAWLAEHPGLHREVLTFEQAHRWITFIGKGRLALEYVHPRGTGELGPFLRSMGLISEYWKPPGG